MLRHKENKVMEKENEKRATSLNQRVRYTETELKPRIRAYCVSSLSMFVSNSLLRQQ